MGLNSEKYLKILAGGIDGTIDDKSVRQSVLVNVYAAIGIVFMIFFGFVAMQNSNHIIFYLIVAQTLTLIGVVITLYTTQKFVVAGWILTLSLFVTMPVMILYSEITSTLFWLYSFPLVAIVTIGRKPGSVFSLLLLIITVYLISTSPLDMPEYKKELTTRFFATYISVFGLMLFSEYIRYLTNKSLLETNIENSNYVDMIHLQRDEIMGQKDLLEELQPELEKLSIVASETDNAVVITDAEGNYEWINGGYERMFGLKLPELIAERGKSLQASNSDPEILNKIKTCISEKKSVSFEMENLTIDNKTIWTKRELTPVLDVEGKLKQLISIDSDITKIKKVQRDITEQHQEISKQKEELESRNVEILENRKQVSSLNEHIKAGITYASTIQKASLISTESIAKYFENFVLFSPKHIVSGDFYWFSALENDKFCFAIADNSTHGVPGAFISLLNGRLLSEIIKENKEYDSQKSLNALLEKSAELNESDLQAAIVFVDRSNPRNIKLSCAANSKMIALRTCKNEIEILENGTRLLGEGDLLYLFTDGLNLAVKDLLLEMGNQTLAKQKELSKEKIIDLRRKDDISFIGVKL